MLERIKETIANTLAVDADIIKPETSLKEDLEADSLDFVELVMSLEDEFDVKIGEDDTAKIQTVQDIIDYLKAQGVEE
ncbi:MAG: acyl carrier protein [Frisingicoccus sp.]|uniref:acyl carrier protein n=1 Tax=Frisingicoccus sp. TaxID=1918627 RepID=UPI0025BCA43B|nr:acyl carrier protein [Frisingicoccus sp.]MDY4833636.1 acyl carrier protein [Frisingicoccus sp.]MDY5956201.1 acyl carrier protein [Frisingicoccus sp.]